MSRVRRWGSDLGMGARLTVAGGRDGWTRTVMTAVGVGLGAALLLLAGAVPGTWASRGERIDARENGPSGGTTSAALLMAPADTVYRDQPVRGRLLRAEGPQVPVPPGLSGIPAPGEAVVSPALRELLSSSGGALLVPRLPYRITGTIGDAGLAGPAELAYYAGSDRIPAPGDRNDVERVERFGDTTVPEGLDPVLILLVVVIFVVMLLPVAVFVAAAVRFGSDQRDRRLAALRLLGADTAMARRIAAGEALAAAVLGLAVGAVLFLLGRELAARVTVAEITVFAGDIRPGPPLIATVALVVTALAVGVTLLALRGVTIEPLGVVRRARVARSRLWWRILLPATGLALLYPLLGRVEPTERGTFNVAQVAAGVLLLLTGVAALLPWLVEAVVARLRGGSVSWQLATRRLQLHAGSSGRVVNGIAVAVAGAIALQMLFTGVEPDYTRATGADLARAQVLVRRIADPAVEQQLRAVPGVSDVVAQRTVDAADPADTDDDQQQTQILLADCATLRRLADLPGCTGAEVFRSGEDTPGPGTALVLGDGTRWQVPVTARTLTGARIGSGGPFTGLLATPAAIPAASRAATVPDYYLRADLARPDTIERIRNTVAATDPGADVYELATTVVTDRFADVRRGLFIGAVVTLLLIGLSLLVGILEQLRERRRALAVLAAFGTRRATLGWSVLWQTALPVLLGLLVAVPAGIGLGAVLLTMVGARVGLDAVAVTAMAGVAASVVLLVTVATLPVLWRIMRAEGLRTE